MSDLLEAKTLVEKIERYREENNLTIVELARLIGKDKSHVHKVINLVNRPSFQMLIDLAAVMKVPPYSLLIPSQKILNEEFLNEAKSKMSSLGWTETNLYAETTIHPLRIAEIFKGISAPNFEEKNTLSEILGIDQIYYSIEDSFTLLASLLKDLGLHNEQIQLMVEYVRKSIK